jgi:predicted nucleic acid-binding protein
VKFLLDTNVISEIRKRDRAHPNVVHWVTRTPVEDIGTSVLVLAEIRHGIELKPRSDPAKEWRPSSSTVVRHATPTLAPEAATGKGAHFSQ